jgi:hypothetical protein
MDHKNFRVLHHHNKYLPQEKFLFFWLTIYDESFDTLEKANLKLKEHIQRITPFHKR